METRDSWVCDRIWDGNQEVGIYVVGIREDRDKKHEIDVMQKNRRIERIGDAEISDVWLGARIEE
jgi:hypothetical protein